MGRDALRLRHEARVIKGSEGDRGSRRVQHERPQGGALGLDSRHQGAVSMAKSTRVAPTWTPWGCRTAGAHGETEPWRERRPRARCAPGGTAPGVPGRSSTNPRPCPPKARVHPARMSGPVAITLEGWPASTMGNQAAPGGIAGTRARAPVGAGSSATAVASESSPASVGPAPWPWPGRGRRLRRGRRLGPCQGPGRRPRREHRLGPWPGQGRGRRPRRGRHLGP